MKKVLIITHSNDNECTKRVADYLKEKQIEVFRMDTDNYPTNMRLSLTETNENRLHLFSADGDERVLNFDELDAVWYRRLFIGKNIPEDMDPKLREPSLLESRAVVHGLLNTIDAFILDPYQTIRWASNKQVQLRLARKVGLNIPRTLTTNDPDDTREFFKTCNGEMITKMMASFAVYDDQGKEHVVFTNKIMEEDLEDLDGLSLCPMTFQESIPKKVELRVTVIGDQVFTAAIDSQSTGKSDDDWRRDGLGLVKSWVPYELPQEIKQKMLKLMDELKLNYGASDIIVTPDDEYIYLETNPGGEFFWLELEPPNFPLSKAIADVLAGDAYRR